MFDDDYSIDYSMDDYNNDEEYYLEDEDYDYDAMADYYDDIALELSY